MTFNSFPPHSTVLSCPILNISAGSIVHHFFPSASLGLGFPTRYLLYTWASSSAIKYGVCLTCMKGIVSRSFTKQSGVKTFNHINSAPRTVFNRPSFICIYFFSIHVLNHELTTTFPLSFLSLENWISLPKSIFSHSYHQNSFNLQS